MESFEEHYICPITQIPMQDPVIAADGHTYERAAIEDWFKKRDTSPLTGAPLNDKKLIQNHAMRSWIKAQQESLERNKLKPKEKPICFKEFKELEKEWQEKVAETSKATNAEDEWDRLTDSERLTWLEQLGLSADNYQFLRSEFKQFLSSSSQEQRHALKDDQGRYPATEDLWNMLTDLQPEWIVAMHRAQRNSE